jgi:hypothetical protein
MLLYMVFVLTISNGSKSAGLGETDESSPIFTFIITILT